MSTSKKIAYGDLEVRIDDSTDRNNVSVGQTLRRIDYQRREMLQLIPTIDNEVKSTLKLLNEPEEVGNEDSYTRRARLSQLLFENEEHMNVYNAHLRKQASQGPNQPDDSKEKDDDEEDFYTPASDELMNLRRSLIHYTDRRSRERLMREADDIIHSQPSKLVKQRRGTNKRVEEMDLAASQIVSLRPVSQAKLSPNDRLIATANWDGGLGIVESDSLKLKYSLEKTHVGKAGGVSWSADGKSIVSGGEDGLVKHFSVTSTQLHENIAFRGHERRVTDTDYNPTQSFIASASFDMTWRLWDLNTGSELLLQEGHSREVYCATFHCDGSLLCSAGLDCIGMVWDIRSGKCPILLNGHVKPIYSVDWSPNGYQIATGSGDGTIKIWDLRKSNDPFTILAHNNIVSSVSFDRGHGNLLTSSGYDGKVNVFSSDNWVKLKTLEGHTDKVLCSDISKDTKFIVSSSWDRSIKLWKVDK